MKGSNVYISAKELEALHDAASYLSALLETSDEAANLIAAKAGLTSVIEKALNKRRLGSKRKTVRASLVSGNNMRLLDSINDFP